MFCRVIPSWEQIEKFEQPLTEGEGYLLKFLDDNLKKDNFFQGDDLTKYNGWLIFVQPFLNGSRPDIVIFNPNVGVQIFEVKDWNLDCYSFRTEIDGDQSHEVFCVSDSSGTYKKKSPIRQVEHYKEKIYAQLIPQIGESFDENSKQFGIIKTAVYFHKSLTAQVQVLFKSNKSNIFGRDVLEKSNINTIIPDSQRNMSTYWRKEWNKELLFWLNPPYHTIEQGTPLALLNDQKKFAEPQSGHFRVRGVAGSGKTQVLAYRASKLASQGYSVLVLTYNLTLRNLIHEMIRRSPFAFHWNNITITYFHGFCKDVLNDFGEAWPINRGDSEAVFTEVIPSEVSKIIDTHEYKKYDAILIDEGQDFCIEWYSMLCLFLTNRDEVVVVCDKKQNIYGRELKWLDKRVGERTEEGKSQVYKFDKWIDLEKIMRLPERVAKISVKFSKDFNLNQDIKIGSIEKRDLFNQSQDHVVWWNIENDWLDNVDKAFEIIRNHATHNHPSDTVILLPHKYFGFECVHYFESKKNMRVNHVFERRDDKKYHRHKKAFWMDDGRLKMSTIHSFKGWEVPNVIVVIPPSIPGNEELYDRIVYTAITRSRENLIIINAHPRYRDFGECIFDEWRD